VSALAWVERAGAASPPALVARVREVIAALPDQETIPVAEALTRAGEVLLQTALGRPPEQARDGALDLLAADACVTWAFEAAADDPASLPARAQEAMQRIAEVAL
jgi:hypothetical protein